MQPRITFNDKHGRLVQAPKRTSTAAGYMANRGWSFLQGTKSGAGLWFKEAYGHIDAKAFVRSNRVVIHSISPDSKTLEKILSMSPEELTQLGLPKTGDFWSRFTHEGQSPDLFKVTITDIVPFLADLSEFERRKNNRWQINTTRLRVLKAF